MVSCGEVEVGVSSACMDSTEKNSRLAVLLANGFGLGLSPVASGTVGSLLGVLLVGAMLPLAALPYGLVLQCVAAFALAMLSIPICGIAEQHYGKKDDGRIVADEYLTFPICTLGLPWVEHPWILLLAFVTARIFDIFKPPPAYQSQALGGGLGIVADDIIACLYALGVNHLIVHFVL